MLVTVYYFPFILCRCGLLVIAVLLPPFHFVLALVWLSCQLNCVKNKHGYFGSEMTRNLRGLLHDVRELEREKREQVHQAAQRGVARGRSVAPGSYVEGHRLPATLGGNSDKWSPKHKKIQIQKQFVIHNTCIKWKFAHWNSTKNTIQHNKDKSVNVKWCFWDQLSAQSLLIFRHSYIPFTSKSTPIHPQTQSHLHP